jgi:hypothetical protein
MNTITKLALATSAAALFSGAVMTPAFAGDAEGAASVKCQGINSCKGTSKCQTAESACAGQNSCKGHGWLMVGSAEECTEKGGTVVE